MYGCESWTVKKAGNQRIDAFELWYWRRTGHLLGPASLPPSLGAHSRQPGTPDNAVQLRAQRGPSTCSLNTDHRPQGVPRLEPHGPRRVCEVQQDTHVEDAVRPTAWGWHGAGGLCQRGCGLQHLHWEECTPCTQHQAVAHSTPKGRGERVPYPLPLAAWAPAHQGGREGSSSVSGWASPHPRQQGCCPRRAVWPGARAEASQAGRTMTQATRCGPSGGT